MAVKNAMTADFLRSAYGGESMAHMRYLQWGNAAQKEGFPNIARLFEAIAYAEPYRFISTIKIKKYRHKLSSK